MSDAFNDQKNEKLSTLSKKVDYKIKKDGKYLKKENYNMQPISVKENNVSTNKKFQTLSEEIGKLVDHKNAAYGNSCHKTKDFLKMVYPNGIAVDQYSTALAFVRIFDKLLRIASDKDAFGEEPIKDLLGLVIRLLMKEQEQKDKK